MSISGNRCRGTNKRGDPCGARAIEDGLCAAHSGKVDMSAIGVEGGRASVRSRLGLDVAADDDLREKARQRLNEMLDLDSDQVRLAASKALFSYSTTPAPGGGGVVTYPASVERGPEFYSKVLDTLEDMGVLYRGQRPADVDLPEIRRVRQRVAELEAQLKKRSADE